jgi:hypothetical protein
MRRPKPITALAAMAGAGLTVMVVAALAALAGCGPVGAAGAASGPRGSPASTRHSGGGQPRADRASVTANRSSGTMASADQGGRAPAIGELCAHLAAVTIVRVMRIPSLAQMGGTKPPPRQVPGIVVGDAGKARELAQVVCSLPTMPHAVWQCPVVVGGGYVLEFMSGRQQFRPVTIQASGCEAVLGVGVGGTRWVARTPGFWPTMAHLTGIRAPAHSP